LQKELQKNARRESRTALQNGKPCIFPCHGSLHYRCSSRL